MANDNQDGAAVRLFPPGVPLAVIVMGWVLGHYFPLAEMTAPDATILFVLGGVIIVVAFFGLGVWSVLLFCKSGQSVKPWDATPEIPEAGPYKITRSPMYL